MLAKKEMEHPLWRTEKSTLLKKTDLKSFNFSFFLFFFFFFELYTNKTIHRYFSRILVTYTFGAFTKQLFSEIAILTEHI